MRTRRLSVLAARVTVRPGSATTSIKVAITATPVGKANRAKYRDRTWTRTWSVT